MTSCGPSVDLTGLDDGGDTDGTGVGPVTGFGSVIVNGVRYDDAGIDNTNFFDDHGRTKADLKAGMMVNDLRRRDQRRVGNGTADEHRRSCGTSTARWTTTASTLATNRLKVMGQDGRCRRVHRVRQRGGREPARTCGRRQPPGRERRHPELEVHGIGGQQRGDPRHLHPQVVRQRGAGRDVQVRGNGGRTATRLAQRRSSSGGRRWTSPDVHGGPPAGVDAGSFVEVKGTFRASDNTLLATSVNDGGRDRRGRPSGDQGKVEGYVEPGGDARTQLRPDRPERGPDRDSGPRGRRRSPAGRERTSGAGVKVEVEGTRKPRRDPGGDGDRDPPGEQYPVGEHVVTASRHRPSLPGR